MAPDGAVTGPTLSIVIAGSGAIGVEFAYVLVNFGVDVTIVEFLDRMVPTEDPDVSKELLKQYKNAEALAVVKGDTVSEKQPEHAYATAWAKWPRSRKSSTTTAC